MKQGELADEEQLAFEKLQTLTSRHQGQTVRSEGGFAFGDDCLG
jgi:hypothetical protein